MTDEQILHLLEQAEQSTIDVMDELDGKTIHVNTEPPMKSYVTLDANSRAAIVAHECGYLMEGSIVGPGRPKGAFVIYSPIGDPFYSRHTTAWLVQKLSAAIRKVLVEGGISNVDILEYRITPYGRLGDGRVDQAR